VRFKYIYVYSTEWYTISVFKVGDDMLVVSSSYNIHE
jgi:hypothetical protein